MHYFTEVHVFREKEKDVKKIAIRLLLMAALMVACASTVMADGGPLPSCKPPLVCVAK